ncbi:MAG TPA: guanylate kinase, partial [Phycisphaerales bacterium]|nr:guanylate kinase [Phycisphaerales bacterium]
GKSVILEIDVQGARKTKAIYPDALMIFVMPPAQKVLAERLNGRGRDDERAREKRLNGAGNEMAAAWQYYEYMVINDDLEKAINEVIGLIEQD